jgi:glycosyltransferase involved in cell wall biosynthesis
VRRNASVVEEFCGRDPSPFRYVFEPKEGKSHALNTGIREAHGDMVASTDDDVIVEPTCLQNLTLALDGNDWASVRRANTSGPLFRPSSMAGADSTRSTSLRGDPKTLRSNGTDYNSTTVEDPRVVAGLEAAPKVLL